MSGDSNIVLAGPMGVGKTVVGELVASRLGRPFQDTDRVIEELTGIPLVRIFLERSEAYFRSLERDVVKDIARRSGLVIAAGGGMMIHEDNLRDLVATGVVICLSASLQTLVDRIGKPFGRPLLKSEDIRTELESILADRKRNYERIPLQLATDNLTIEETAARVIDIYRSQTAHV